MNFIVSSALLLKNLQVLTSVANPNNTVAILKNVLFELDNNKLTLTTSDLETTISASLEVNCNFVSAFAVDASLITETLKTFAEQPLTIKISDYENQIELVSNMGNYFISFFNANDFPKIFTLEDPIQTVIPIKKLEKIIHHTLLGVSKDDSRKVLTGAYFQFTNQGAEFVSTDAKKLVKYETDDVTSEESFDFIIPKKTLTVLKSIIFESDDNVQIKFNDKNVEFVAKNLTVFCRLLDGKYPNYNSVIPNDNQKKLIVNRQLLLNAVKRISLFSNKSDYQMVLTIKGNELAIFTENDAFSIKGQERLSCEFEGTDTTIALNSKLLMEILSNLNSENVLITMKDEQTAILIYSNDNIDKGEKILALLMPITRRHARS